MQTSDRVLANEVAKLVGLRLTDEQVAALVAHEPVALSRQRLAVTAELLCDMLEAHGVFVENLFKHGSDQGAVEALYKLVTVRPDVVDERVLLAAGAVTVAGTLCRLLNAATPPLLDVNADPLTAEHVLTAASVDPLSRLIVHRVIAMSRTLSVSPAANTTAEALGASLGPCLFQPEASLAKEKNPAALALKSMAVSSVVADMCKSSQQLFPQPYARLSAPCAQAVGIAPTPMTEAEWAKVLASAQLVKCDAKDFLFEEGKPNSRLFRVRNGTFDVLLGGKVVMHNLGATTLFGELSLLDRDATSYGSVVCTSTTAEVWAITLDDVANLDATIAKRFWEHLALACAVRLVLATRVKSNSPVDQESVMRMAPAEQLRSSEHSKALKVVGARYNAMWGSLVIDSECVAHHGALLGLTRSTVWMRDHIKEVACDKKTCTLSLADGGRARLKFHSADECEAARASLALLLSQTTLDSLRMSLHTHSQKVVNPLFLATVVGNYKSSAPHTLQCKAGERVVIVGKEGAWYWARATHSLRDPKAQDAEGWVPEALVAGANAYALGQSNSFKTSPVLASLVASATERKLGPNEVLLTEGDMTHTGTALYIVASGFCIAKKGTFTMPLYQDSITGEVTFLLGGAPTATVVASSEGATVLVLPATQLERHFAADPQNATHFFTFMCFLLYNRIKSTLEMPQQLV